MDNQRSSEQPSCDNMVTAEMRMTTGTCNFVLKADDELKESVERFWQIDSYGTNKESLLSVNNQKVLKNWNDSQLPDNWPLAEKRLRYLDKRLLKDETRRQKYTAEINSLVTKGYAEKVEEETAALGMTWYIPHHSVYNVNSWVNVILFIFACIVCTYSYFQITSRELAK